MNIEPIKKTSVVEMAIGKIYDLILAGNLKENDSLPPERLLSEMLGISRNSLREAIRVLDMLGILRVDQGRGMILETSCISATVTRHVSFALLLNRDKLAELFEARLVIETECAGLAAEKATPEEIAGMRAVYAELTTCGPDRERGIALEMRLHALVAKAAHNTVLEQILSSLGGVLRDSREKSVPPSGVTDATVASQEMIIGAIARRDSSRARAFMFAHIAAVAARVRDGADARYRELTADAALN